ncbi:hypothetical protein ACE6H2_013926 [Prunus campanulata]
MMGTVCFCQSSEIIHHLGRIRNNSFWVSCLSLLSSQIELKGEFFFFFKFNF